MKCHTCDSELYPDGSCPLMCVWTDQENPSTITVPITVRFKAVIASDQFIRVRYISSEDAIS